MVLDLEGGGADAGSAASSAGAGSFNGAGCSTVAGCSTGVGAGGAPASVRGVVGRRAGGGGGVGVGVGVGTAPVGVFQRCVQLCSKDVACKQGTCTPYEGAEACL